MTVVLPIDVVPHTDPPVFRWKQTVDGIGGRQVVDHCESLPSHVEVAVSRTIAIVKQLLHDNAAAQGVIHGLTSKVEALESQLGKKMDAAAPPAVPRKGK